MKGWAIGVRRGGQWGVEGVAMGREGMEEGYERGGRWGVKRWAMVAHGILCCAREGWLSHCPLERYREQLLCLDGKLHGELVEHILSIAVDN